MDRKIRLSELYKIPALAGRDYRHSLNKDGRLPFWDKLSRSERRVLKSESKKISETYTKIIKKLYSSGAGFAVDRTIRRMASEYTHRYASSGLYNQPVSFNYFEPFLHIKLIRQVAPFAEVESEISHIFSVEDFFDFVTSNYNYKFEISSLKNIPADQIFHFSTSGNVKEISFLNGENREFVVSGFSMIRRGGAIHWYLVGGEEFSEEEWELKCLNQEQVDLAGLNPQKRAFLMERISETGLSKGEPIALEGTRTHLKTIVAGEFDISEKKHISRCYMAEYSNSFSVICDDPEILSGTIFDNDDFIKKMMARFSRLSALWSLCEAFFQLPEYFNARIALNESVSSKISRRSVRKKGGKGLNGDYIVIPALEKNSAAPTLAITKVTLPHYEIETEGHWKRLPDGEVGQDRHGNPVKSKTWISSSSKWKSNLVSDTIFMKDLLATAKMRISDLVRASVATAAGGDALTGCVAAGELYVMRCSAMKENIFKVGFTSGSSEERAKQLSSATGVPSSFVVVRKWKHVNAKKLEVDVHMMLLNYRLNDNREFFVAELSVIEEVINLVLSRTASEN